MRWTGPLSNFWVGVVAGLTAAGCDSATGNKDPRITISVASPTATIGQGGATTVSMTVVRANFTGAVALSADGLPAGVTAEFTPASLPSGTTVSSLLISATGAATPGTSTLTVHATGQGVTEETATIDLTITVTGSFSITSFKPSVTVAQGGGGMATVVITRTGGNASGVTLAVTGAPTGLTAAFASTPTTERGASLTLTAAASTPPGTYTLTVTGSSPGLTNQTTILSVTVIAPPSVALLTIPFCSADMPVWFAYQNDGYPWQQLAPSGAVFAFNATQRVGIAFVFQSGNNVVTRVYHVTRTELSGITDFDCRGPNTVMGSVTAVSGMQTALVALGSATASVSAPATGFTLQSVPARTLDLVATRGTLAQELLTPDAMIIRRSLTQADQSTISTLDFAAQSFVPASSTLTIAGLQPGDEMFFQNVLLTANGTAALVQSALPTTVTSTLYAVPAPQQIAGDMHQLYVDALQATTTSVTGRSYFTFYATPADQAEPLGPTLNAPTVAGIGSSPYARLRGQVASQPEYNTSAGFAFDQGSGFRRIFVRVSAANLGGAPTTWEVEIPDFTGTQGFSASWMLSPGITNTVYQAEAFSGRTELLFGAPPANGELVKTAYRSAFTSTAVYAPSLSARGKLRSQYFRR